MASIVLLYRGLPKCCRFYWIVVDLQLVLDENCALLIKNNIAHYLKSEVKIRLIRK